MKIARFEGERVFPADFPNSLYDVNTCSDDADRQPVCPECQDPVTHVSESIDGREAHFKHCPASTTGGGGGGCPGSTVAERDEHRAMKSIAVERLEAIFEQTELEIVDSGTERHFEYAGRTADGFVEFAGRDEQLGHGILVEAQYRNKSKDIAQTMWDYHKNTEFAVLWLTTDDFDTESASPEDWRLNFIDADEVRGRLWLQTWPYSNLSKWNRTFVESFRPVGLAARYLEEVRTMPHGDEESEKIIPAHLPRECVAEIALESWRNHDWEALLDVPEDYTDIWAYAKVPAQLPDEYFSDAERAVFRSIDWDDLFTSTTAGEYIEECRQIANLPGGRIRVKLPRSAVLEHQRDQRRTQLSPPPTPFEDVQCWNCGNYWHRNEERLYCQNCGVEVDFEWNARTGRISEIPAYAQEGNGD